MAQSTRPAAHMWDPRGSLRFYSYFYCIFFSSNSSKSLSLVSWFGRSLGRSLLFRARLANTFFTENPSIFHPSKESTFSTAFGNHSFSLMSGWVENVGSTDPLSEFEVHSLPHSQGLLCLGIRPINPPGKRVESCCYNYDNEERRSH